MNYLLKTNAGRLGSGGSSGRNKNPFSLGRIIGGAIVAIIAFWWIFFTPTFMTVISHRVASGVTVADDAMGGFFGAILTYFKSKTSLEKENETLRDKLFAQDVQMVNFELLKKQNAELKEAFNRIDKTNLIAAAIIRSVAASPYDTFLIEGGKRAGIQPGDVALVQSAVPVGYVSKVFDNSAEVTMYSAPGETIEGVLTVPSTEPAGTGRLRTLFVTLTGKGGGNFDIRLTKDVDVPSGAFIAMPGLATRLLATVYGSDIDSAGGTRVLHALSAVNMLHEATVYIEPGHNE